MAMNKKEQAEFRELEKRLLVAQAWRRTERVLPDVPPPKGMEKDTSGFVFNSYSMEVKPAWSSSASHGRGYSSRKKGLGGSQNGISLYSTEVLALRAMRYEVECEANENLAKIDAMISSADAQDKEGNNG